VLHLIHEDLGDTDEDWLQRALATLGLQVERRLEAEARMDEIDQSR
jgi:hypothetical protein